MEKIASKLLIETEDIQVYSNVEYNNEFLERLVNYYTKSKKRILDFFEVAGFRKIRVNLFETKQAYDDCFSKLMQISKYGIGNCYMGEINYVCTKQDLESVPKAGLVIASIVHEFVHLVYHEKVTKNKCVWLEEGLAQFLSGQKSFLETDENRYNEWLRKNIFEKEIPKIEYLKEHGSIYGKFCDIATNKYNGYDISYALVRYIVSRYSKEELNEIMRNDKKKQDCEKAIISEFINAVKESAK